MSDSILPPNWEADYSKGEISLDGKTAIFCRNPRSHSISGKQWKWRSTCELRRMAKLTTNISRWEIDWDKTRDAPSRTGRTMIHRRWHRFVWARNLTAKCKAAREWHFVNVQHLQRAGLSTPDYRKDAWEVDWSKRMAKRKPSGQKSDFVWARNLNSPHRPARDWHWVGRWTLRTAGIAWIGVKTGPKHLRPTLPPLKPTKDGYALTTRSRMMEEEIALAEKSGLFKKGPIVREHRLRAVERYGAISENILVRHRNGLKSDNRPENLLIGTVAMNNADHHTAHLWLFELYSRYTLLAKKYNALRKKLNESAQLAFPLEESEITLTMESVECLTSQHQRPGS